MSRLFESNLHAASRAATLFLPVLIVSLGCDQGSDTLAPARAAAAAAQASNDPIPGAVDDITAIVNAVTAAWTAKDAAGYTAPYASDVQVVNPLGARIA